ncbi:TPA: DegT/DnrJ/EryC1/StrS family aminotransferase [Staphylococcus aureus]|uniref:DegT/DnrJ/EryC1/StrS family aminotransferase n=1 Tax=Staphylococcus aureus TaxID=1280 RepID=UPI000910E8CD|nr:DegT/DnrJ/EryC1/StrS family aminotransferase [Staphylococcus aureus]MBS3303682.1 DegT/DnrJ/EryC1/StrS family aminotransferase [Staphylococcus aureus]MBS3338691.1 DegT/DnrJ/EryC1/StrS family aminotransferase [Staphylococcus aureus]MBS3341162.1 DegT/DnrJ/EryC1/StrS family aminotransferase [Staphylococcus aureus]MCG5141109.1 DegT/DnrJ/EryC1/StrS family aminotransferase [Staphylococcus aureus]MCQ1170943.1 DegT/DnrJ/EryC1/StrS family aminotransferase [Staphylococcus aureus]
MSERNIPFSPPTINEEDINKVVEVLKSGWITTGPKTKQFEKDITEYVGSASTVALNSCTAALEMTLKVLGIGEGDEVIVPAYTYTATASAVAHVGATIKMIDTANESFEMDYEILKNYITKKTKAIIPVDLAGKPINYDEIFKAIENKKELFTPNTEIQKSFNRIVVIADGAHSLGAKRNNISVGNIADFTCFSFHAVKNLTTGEGGAVTWKENPSINNEAIYKQYMLLSLHGQSKDALAKTKAGNWEYDIVAPLYKCNMTDIQAAIGITQLERYEAILNRRKEIISIYDDILSSSKINILQHFNDIEESSGHLYLTRVPNMSQEQRNLVIEKMAEKGISTNVHYKPLPLLTAYKNLGFNIENYPNAYNQFINEITLPLHLEITDEDAVFIAESFVEIVNEVTNNELSK